MLVLAPSSFSLATVAVALLAVALVALAVPVGTALRKKLRISKGLAPVPGPKGWPLLGMLPDILMSKPHVYEFIESLQVKYGGRIHMPWTLFADSAVWLATPEDVQYVLATNNDNYIRAPRFIGVLTPESRHSYLGLNHAHTPDNGAMIRLQRKLGIRVLTTNNFKVYTEQVFAKHARDAVAQIHASSGGNVDFHDIASTYTLQSIFAVSCGVSLQDLDASRSLEFIHAIDNLFAHIGKRMIEKPYFKYFWWCMPSEYAMKRNEKIVLDMANDILLPRLHETNDELAKRSDIMSLFIQKAREDAADDTNADKSVLDIRTLRSILCAFVVAGTDTSASVLSYVFYALAQYPEVQQRLFEEVNNADTLSYDSVKRLVYLDAVVNETMRLYPTLPSTFRVAAEDDHLPDGTFIPAGTEIWYSPWYMGRHNPVFGDKRDEFRPERWLDMKTRPSAYDLPVFSAGPRNCIGMNLAFIEMRLFIAVIVREFHVKIQDGEQLKNRPYNIGPTLTLAGGLPLVMTPRKEAKGGW